MSEDKNVHHQLLASLFTGAHTNKQRHKITVSHELIKGKFQKKTTKMRWSTTQCESADMATPKQFLCLYVKANFIIHQNPRVIHHPNSICAWQRSSSEVCRAVSLTEHDSLGSRVPFGTVWACRTPELMRKLSVKLLLCERHTERSKLVSAKHDWGCQKTLNKSVSCLFAGIITSIMTESEDRNWTIERCCFQRICQIIITYMEFLFSFSCLFSLKLCLFN